MFLGSFFAYIKTGSQLNVVANMMFESNSFRVVKRIAMFCYLQVFLRDQETHFALLRIIW